ncbi:multiple cyclophane-containing RiPP AmcA [Rhizohabitans arisaemae]|uniref:multiple cyclophane-containing RiPP AmcA n=1 Tax=Rhizohabitans arisaemae TaxID=2720610 RepID=UPI0024B21F30|nr:multiple cyclophane-containing RiPP AmcA [Rhizohabitans arisaemae]
MPVLEYLVTTTSDVVRDLIRLYVPERPVPMQAGFNNQPSWDNWSKSPGPFDNRPSWDNWSKK